MNRIMTFWQLWRSNSVIHDVSVQSRATATGVALYFAMITLVLVLMLQATGLVYV